MSAPQTPKLPPAEEAPHAERTRGADGNEYWNLTCFCGKRLLAPADGPHKQGRCPQCSRRLLFPSREKHITTGPLPIIPARREDPPRVERIPWRRAESRVHKPTQTPEIEKAGTIHNGSARFKPGLSAADNAAEKLRPKRGMSERGMGLVSAWPPAGNGPRVLAAFVDLTLVAVGSAILLAASGSLPAFCSSVAFQIFIALLLYEINDGVLQLSGRGSIGRRLAVIVLKGDDGESPSATKTLIRPLLKLALFPGVLMLFGDENRRALHDRILGTRVLKGRISARISSASSQLK